jgi:Kdo2-lipid IVA lauroyltransferase/acyltransferase
MRIDTGAEPAPSAPRWLAPLSRLPWTVLYALAATLAFLARCVLRYRLGVVRTNIAGSFPDLQADARRQIERDYYRGLGQLVAEVIKSATLARAELEERVILSNLEVVSKELDAGRSVLIVAAHQCNWEWLLLALSLKLRHPLEAAYKPLHGSLGERLMHAIRTRFGARLVPAKDIVSSILARREPRAIAMVADQEPVTSEHKWWTRFLNRPTAFYMGPEKIAQLTRFAVFFAAMRRTGRGRYRVEFETLAEARQAIAPGAVTEGYARRVEAQILANPADWTWSHRRWKLRRPMYSAAASTLDQGSI